MGYAKEQLIQAMEEEREDLTQTLDDVEAVGENYACPNNDCESKVCSKSCFVRRCFDWCLTHERPSTEDTDGEIAVQFRYTTKDVSGHVVSRTKTENRRVCGHQAAREYPGVATS
ncbi:hypothetical protein CCHR01_14333 [Colletotrichum chrysophilum]|uniref:Uncharacterized protein n=1 Tax=Colletotrichum chrysophilum TaxID=1836956 RepID=A0AAD9A7P6_9PEZI|nr:hypothetical protein CCHR01_14333 [Colletotrichum chrysophilum]